MNYSNEVKVGLSIVLAVVVLIVGVRYFQDLPILSSSYLLTANFENVSGLSAGNPVRLSGVNVGTVESVQLQQDEETVRVRFRVNENVLIPEGSMAEVRGFSALGGVRLGIRPGPSSNPPLQPGSIIDTPSGPGLLDQLTQQGPEMTSKVDSVLGNTSRATEALASQMEEGGDLQQTLASLRNVATTLESVSGGEEETLRSAIQNLEALTADLEAFTSENSDSLGVTVQRVNQNLTRLEQNLANLERTTAALGSFAEKINSGEGTLGRLANDPSLYNNLDSTSVQMNRLLRDLQENPQRYLEDMTLVRMF
ncbi:mammalian cell entry protein [Longimonas halophila]|uniref:Mammalian cell entry protein n=1 Tax=Longimonas halophila TaxID=1469170 RepID=A0A2H3NM35_9BACT|nr:MlaD family protein [Longimonas halophila]PEN07688.1 mammalian cell entry protein [Longimonas halophila]